MHEKTQGKATTGAGAAEGWPAGVRTKRVEWLGIVNDCIGGQVGAQVASRAVDEGRARTGSLGGGP
jgi:hypothetical protein